MASSSKSLITILSLITASLISIATFIRKLLNVFTDYRNDKKKQEYDEKVQKAKNELKDACDNGDLSDLVNAAKKLGEAKNG